MSDLNNAIVNKERAVELTDNDHPSKAIRLSNLGISQQSCFECHRKLADLLASASSFKRAAKLETAYPSKALLAARKWAEISYLSGDLMSALEGYHTALELLPKVAWLGLNTSSRQHWLLQE
jgi:hypothetical protein